MEDPLINFETAKLAKEKGFDILLPTYYTHVKIEPSVQIDDKWFKNSQFSETDYKLCSAPTQSLLQTWLRRVHKWHIEVLPDNSTEDIRWVAIVYHLDNMDDMHSLEYCDGFEEALEIGLVSVLNNLD